MEALARPFGQKNKKKLFCVFELPNTPNYGSPEGTQLCHRVFVFQN
jgi:hypothetical protein